MAKTRRNRKTSSRKASRKNQMGGKRKASDWNKFTKRVYEEMKRKDSNVMFRDALVEAGKRKRAGKM